MKKEGITAIGCQGDVRKIDDCARWVTTCVETYGSLNIVVNCAAGNFLATAEELSSGGFRSVMEIDALGTFNMSRAAHSALSKAKNASIINISATLHYGASWWQVHASAAKAAVDSITRTLAMEWGSAGIRVNGVAPGPIQVHFTLSSRVYHASSHLTGTLSLSHVPTAWSGILVWYSTFCA